MLAVFSRISDMDFDALLDVYSQSLDKNNWQEVNTFFDDLQLFFDNENVYLMQWVQENKVMAAMRLETYRDGYLITCLETDPNFRRKGCAYKLLNAVMTQFPGVYYSHVDKRNKPSLLLHQKLGFEIYLNHAVYVDGSVYSGSVTLRK